MAQSYSSINARMRQNGANIRARPASSSGGGGGTMNHADLTNRDAAGQHPISAITGLQDEITELHTDIDNMVPVDKLHIVDIDDISSVAGLDFSSFSAGDIIFAVGNLNGV